MAGEAEESQRCPRCGTFEWEADHYNSELWKCEGCAMMEVAQDAINKDTGSAVSKFGIRPVLVRGSDSG